MSATIEAVTQNKNDIPWNKHVRQKQKPGDLAVSGIINVLLLLTIVAVLYPLWFVVIASFQIRTPWPAVKCCCYPRV